MGAWSGLWNDEHGEDHALLIDKSSLEKRLSLLMRQRGMGELKELMATLNGATAPAAAAATRYQVEGRQGLTNELGGVVPIEAVTVISRNALAADVTRILQVLGDLPYPTTYPADASGNGGGGKLGF